MATYTWPRQSSGVSFTLFFIPRSNDFKVIFVCIIYALFCVSLYGRTIFFLGTIAEIDLEVTGVDV